MTLGERILRSAQDLAAILVSLALLGVLLFLFFIPVALVIGAVLLLAGAAWFVSTFRKKRGPTSTIDVQARELHEGEASGPAGWLIAGADLQQSRRSRLPGASDGRVLWTWTPALDDPYIHEPLVSADGQAIVVPCSGKGRHILAVLAPDGALRNEIVLPHPPWCDPVLGDGNTLFAGSWGLLMAMNLDGTILWQQQLPGFVCNLRPTATGDLMTASREGGFAAFTGDGRALDSPYRDLRSWLGGMALHLSFDKAGNLYAAREDTLRMDPGEMAEHFGGIAAFDPQGHRRWGRELTARDATDDPEYSVEHIWALDDSAVFFADRKIQCYSAAGNLHWEITSLQEGSIAIRDLELSLSRDPRIFGGPLLAKVSGARWEYLKAAIDGAGNIYSCCPNAVFSLDPEGGLRWRVRLPEEQLHDPVIGPGETLLVRSYGKVYGIG